MYRDRVGRLQLGEHIGGILHDMSLKIHRDELHTVIHPGDLPDVPIEDPHARLGPFGVLPHHVVVVFHLHHPVPLAEHIGPELPLPLLRGGGIYGGLNGPVEAPGAAVVLPGGGKHLDLFRRDAHIFGQPFAHQLHNSLLSGERLASPEEKHVLGAVVMEGGHDPLVHLVSRTDDGALGRLAEHLVEPHHGHPAAPDQVGEQIPRPHAGELVRVPHQHQAAVLPEGG